MLISHSYNKLCLYFLVWRAQTKNTSFWLYGTEAQYLLVVLKVLKHESAADVLRHLHMFITLGCIYGFHASYSYVRKLLKSY